jgi:FlaA1/EpsC-like NDP-sugar epimerase
MRLLIGYKVYVRKGCMYTGIDLHGSGWYALRTLCTLLYTYIVQNFQNVIYLSRIEYFEVHKHNKTKQATYTGAFLVYTAGHVTYRNRLQTSTTMCECCMCTFCTHVCINLSNLVWCTLHAEYNTTCKTIVLPML